MFPFKRLSSPEYERLHTENLALEKKIILLEQKIDKVEDQLKSFRGRFYQHVGQGDDEEPTEKTYKGGLIGIS